LKILPKQSLINGWSVIEMDLAATRLNY